MGDFIMIRPAEIGKEHLLERINFPQFAKMFDPFTAMFLMPDQLDESDYSEPPY